MNEIIGVVLVGVFVSALYYFIRRRHDRRQSPTSAPRPRPDSHEER